MTGSRRCSHSAAAATRPALAPLPAPAGPFIRDPVAVLSLAAAGAAAGELAGVYSRAASSMPAVQLFEMRR
jgi:hypothetical protein